MSTVIDSPFPISMNPFKHRVKYNKTINELVNNNSKGGDKLARRAGTIQPSQSTRPFLTPEGQENHLVSLANNLVEQRLRDGTASSQEVCHFLKLGSAKERLEREKLEEENKLLRAKTENMKAQTQMEELYKNAISAMSRYQGHGGDEDDY